MRISLLYWRKMFILDVWFTWREIVDEEYAPEGYVTLRFEQVRVVFLKEHPIS